MEIEPVGKWQDLAAALRAYGKAQNVAWGTVDDVAIAKYLDGTCSPEQRRSVEKAIDTHPACRELIQVLKQVLNVPDALAKAPEMNAAESPWKGVGSGWQLADRLAARLAEDGTMVVAGLKLLLKGPEAYVARTMNVPGKKKLKGFARGQDEVETARWEIPLPGEGGSLHISIRPSRRAETWELHCRLALPAAAAPSRGGWLSIRNRQGKRIHAGPLEEGPGGREGRREPVYLKSGEYRISIKLGDQVLEFPVEVGSLAAGA